MKSAWNMWRQNEEAERGQRSRVIFEQSIFVEVTADGDSDFELVDHAVVALLSFLDGVDGKTMLAVVVGRVLEGVIIEEVLNLRAESSEPGIVDTRRKATDGFQAHRLREVGSGVFTGRKCGGVSVFDGGGKSNRKVVTIASRNIGRAHLIQQIVDEEGDIVIIELGRESASAIAMARRGYGNRVAVQEFVAQWSWVVDGPDVERGQRVHGRLEFGIGR